VREVDLLIEGGVVMTLNTNRRIFEKGSVAINGSEIIDVGQEEELRKRYPQPKHTIDAKNKLVMPGLINTHIHLIGYPVMKGIRPGNYGYGNPYLQRLYTILGNDYWNEEIYYYSGLLSCIEMIKSGTTSVVDCGTPVGSEEMGVKLIADSGIRGVLALETMDIFEKPGYFIAEKRREHFGSTQKNIDRTEDFIKKYDGVSDGRINIWTSVMQVMNSSDDLIKGLKVLRDEYKVGMTIHANVMRPMTEVVEKAWGKPDTERLGQLGILGPDCLLAHACDLNGRELMMIRDTHTNLSHNIFTSMNLAYGAALWGRFPQWQQMGINIGLGTDDQCCSNHMDMFRAINATFLVHKEVQFDNNLWSPQTVLEMATINGARCMMSEDSLGSLESGKKADIILIDLMTPDWVPWHKFNLIENLVLSSTGATVDTSIINGKIVMEAREIKTFDEREVLKKIQDGINKLVEKLNFCSSDLPYPENLPPLW
jgi:5-methylthioadenosine/S-adenosylhomocysteine deaminase